MGSILEKFDLPPKSDVLSTLTPPPGFTQGENVMKKIVKRKWREEDDGEGVGEQQLMASTKILKSPTPISKGKSIDVRATRKNGSQVSHKRKHRSGGLKEYWGCDFVVEGCLVDKEDSVMKNKDGHEGLVVDVVGRSLLLLRDMKSWQENNSEHVIKNLICNSVLVFHK